MAAKQKPAAPILPAPKLPRLHRDFQIFVDRLGLRHFKGSEFTPYWTRTRDGVQNRCPDEIGWYRIVPTLIVLDEIRHQLDAPITLNSTYRSPAYNAAVGGEPDSFHMRFMAIDFSVACGARELHRLALTMRGKLFRLPGNGGTFRFAGGIGLYIASNFVHLDCRGNNANWTG